MNKIETFLDKLKSLLEAKKDSKSVQTKLENPDQLAEQIIREIGSDTQRIKL